MDGEFKEKKVSLPFSRDGPGGPSNYDDDDFEAEDDDDSLDSRHNEGQGARSNATAVRPAVALNQSSSDINPFDGALLSRGGSKKRMSAEEMVAKALEGGMWKEHLDAASGKKYYYHVVTRKTVWDLAAELSAPLGGGANDSAEEETTPKGWGGSAETGGDGYESSTSFAGPQLMLPTHVRSQLIPAAGSATDSHAGSPEGGAAAEMERSTFAPWAAASAAGSTPRTDTNNSTPREDRQVEEQPRSRDPSFQLKLHALPSSLPVSNSSGPFPDESSGTPVEIGATVSGAKAIPVVQSKTPPPAATAAAPTTASAKPAPKPAQEKEDTDSDFSTASQMIKEIKTTQEQSKQAAVEEVKKQLQVTLTATAPPALTLLGQPPLSVTPVLQTPTTDNNQQGTGTTFGSLGLRPGVTPSVTPTNPGLQGQPAQTAGTGGLGLSLGLGLGLGQGLGFTAGNSGGLSLNSRPTPTSIGANPSPLGISTGAAGGVAGTGGPLATGTPTTATNNQGVPVTIYTDPSSIQQLTASAEALGHLVRAYKDLKGAGSMQLEDHVTEYRRGQPMHHHGIRDGETGVRSDGAGFSVSVTDEEPSRRHRLAANAALERRRTESQYVARIRQNEELLEEDLLDLVMSMLLNKQGGPLPRAATSKGKPHPKVVAERLEPRSKGSLDTEETDTGIEQVAKFRQYSRVPQQRTQSDRVPLGPCSSNTGPGFGDGMSTTLQELDSFSEAGTLQQMIEGNLEKYIVNSMKKGKVHPSVVRFLLIDVLSACQAVHQYSRTLLDAAKAANSDKPFATKDSVLFEAKMVLLCVDGTRATTRVSELASKVLHCLPCELASAMTSGAENASSKHKLLFRIEHWLTENHLLEVERALTATLREVENSVFDLEAMSMMKSANSRGQKPGFSELDEADLASCISPIVSLFIPAAAPFVESQKESAPTTEPTVAVGGKSSKPSGLPVRRELGSAVSAYGFTNDDAERLLFASRNVVQHAAAGIPDSLTNALGVGAEGGLAMDQTFQGCVVETLEELLAESSIRDAVLRRAAGKYTKKIPAPDSREGAEARRQALQTKAQRDLEVQKEVESQVNRVLERIRFEVETSGSLPAAGATSNRGRKP